MQAATQQLDQLVASTPNVEMVKNFGNKPLAVLAGVVKTVSEEEAARNQQGHQESRQQRKAARTMARQETERRQQEALSRLQEERRQQDARREQALREEEERRREQEAQNQRRELVRNLNKPVTSDQISKELFEKGLAEDKKRDEEVSWKQLLGKHTTSDQLSQEILEKGLSDDKLRDEERENSERIARAGYIDDVRETMLSILHNRNMMYDERIRTLEGLGFEFVENGRDSLYLQRRSGVEVKVSEILKKSAISLLCNQKLLFEERVRLVLELGFAYHSNRPNGRNPEVDAIYLHEKSGAEVIVHGGALDGNQERRHKPRGVEVLNQDQIAERQAANERAREEGRAKRRNSKAPKVKTSKKDKDGDDKKSKRGDRNKK